MNDIYNIADQSNINTRQSYCRLKQPLRKTNVGQKAISFLGPGEWNQLPKSIKEVKSVNSFKHKIKEYYFHKMENKENAGY